MKVSEFDFDLPPGLIAARPAEPRDSCRLLSVPPEGGFGDLSMRDLPGLLNAGDIMVFNDTRVIPSRLTGRRRAARIEVTLHKRAGEGRWRAFARPARKLKQGDAIDFAPGLSALVAGKGEAGEVTLDFGLADGALLAALDRHGAMPLPPYLQRAEGPDARDRADYQTIFAARDGAVAAPTSGLHFTEGLMADLDSAGIGRVFVTLHVGAGTFLPVKVEDTDDHAMHAEWGEIGAAAADAIDRARTAGGRVVAVGTTSLRLLESAAADDGTIRPFAGETAIFITPGYRFKVVDVLVSNFHLPRSTLFMLVSAFAGLERMKSAYAHAKARDYRFYSYGDCSLLFRSDAA
ncbi:MAG: tRNA preQ1(34) S-adenosylmethionine ribosyltransferase-isomerase QueA [Alphaproteobacteria bacterium]